MTNSLPFPFLSHVANTWLAFLYGLSFGSFTACWIWRLRRNLPINGRSKCPTCEKQIHWLMLTPFFGYFFSRGRCIYCKTPISVYYPLVELAFGIAWGLSYLKWGNSPAFYLYASCIWCLLTISITDILDHDIYNIHIILGITIALFISWYCGILIFSITGAITGGVISITFWVFGWIYGKLRGYEEPVGSGDIGILIFLGICVGPKSLINSLIDTMFLLAICLIVLLIYYTVKNKSLKQLLGEYLPLAPFLATAVILEIAFPNEIIRILSLLLKPA